MTIFILIVLALGAAYFFYRSTQATAAVAKQHDIPVPEDGIEAIEYFWRPG